MGKAATVITATLVAVFFSGFVNAGRVYVPQKTGTASTVASAIASRVGDIVSSGAMEGTYIPGYQQDRQVPVKVLNSNDFSARKTYEAARDVLKKRGPAAAAVVGAAAVMWAVDQIGGFIDENGRPMMKKPPSGALQGTPGTNDRQWCWGGRQYCSYDPDETCSKIFKSLGDSSSYTDAGFGFDGTTPTCYQKHKISGSKSVFTNPSRVGSVCPTGSAYNDEKQYCQPVQTGPDTGTEFADSDYDKLFDTMNSASGTGTAGDPNFVRDLIHRACEGSLAPQRCYDSLAANAPGAASQSLSGPSSVTAPGTSSISVSKDKDGNATATTTTNNTTFNITYGNNYYNYSSTTTKTKTNPDGSTETTTEEEPEDDATKYPTQPDALTPVIKEYDKVTDALKSQETVDGADRSAWFSFGGGCSELDFDSPIGHVRTNWCPTIEGYVKPCLGFLFSVGTFIYIFSLWKETTMEVRPT